MPKNIHLVPKKQLNFTFYTKNEIFCKKKHSLKYTNFG